jgi:two-component system CheB/CheR fusion protein
MFPVVGIGSSAGGVEALRALFDKMPPKTGMAFILVSHLAPDWKACCRRSCGGILQ